MYHPKSLCRFPSATGTTCLENHWKEGWKGIILGSHPLLVLLSQLWDKYVTCCLGADEERVWFLPGRLKINMLVPSCGTFTQDKKAHHVQDYFRPGRSGNQLKWLSGCGAWSLQKEQMSRSAEVTIYILGLRSATLNTQFTWILG